jgi:ribosomal protein S18 acetylase RimI-like enzyme
MILPAEPSESTKKYFSDRGLLIRPALDSELERLIEMRYKIYDELCPRLSRWYRENPGTFKEEFYGYPGQDPKRRAYYSVEDSGRLVGCGGLIQACPKKEMGVAELTNLYLLSGYRGAGCGKVIMVDLIEKAREMGFERIFLTTRAEFESAIRLYRWLGFMEKPNPKYRSKIGCSKSCTQH